jgi:hypothetical protein
VDSRQSNREKNLVNNNNQIIDDNNNDNDDCKGNINDNKKLRYVNETSFSVLQKQLNWLLHKDR